MVGFVFIVFGLSFSRLVGRLVGRLVDRLVDWLIGWFVGWLVDWLVGNWTRTEYGLVLVAVTSNC